jgi:YHS domain-containing protein
MKTFTRFMFSLGCAAVLLAGQSDPINKDGKGVAIKGYDPVAYFTQSKPVKGSPSFTQQWMGSTWWFSSAEDRDQFSAAPEKFAPQFGGYCAYGVSQNHTVSVDPEAWRIVEGKLYLNYSKGVQQKWVQDVPGNIKKAEENWPKLHK